MRICPRRDRAGFSGPERGETEQGMETIRLVAKDALVPKTTRRSHPETKHTRQIRRICSGFENGVVDPEPGMF